MDTIFKIMKSFIEEKNNNYFIKKYNLSVVDGFIFSFTGNKNKNKQRLMLYKRSLKKHLPNSKIELIDGLYYVSLINI